MVCLAATDGACLSMAQEGIPLFHNFFDIVSPLKEVSRKQPILVATDNPYRSGKNSSLTEEVGPEGHPLGASQSSSVFDESVAAPISDSKDLSHRSSQMDMNALDSSRLFKKSRVETLDEMMRGHAEATMDDLNLTMQPPRILSKPSNLHPSKLDVPAVISKTRDCTNPASLGMLGPGWTSQKGPHADNLTANNFKDSAAAPLLQIPPADEGSRTGLKGSSVGSLLNRALAGGPGLSLGHSKSSSRGAGSESTFVASQEAAPITRQLTIFYGGQAHVFEDVSSDKAEAIMTLAGSNGRSWSTVYSPRPKSGMPLSVSEGSLSTLERERAQSGSKPSSMKAFENSLGVSTEIHNALSSLLHKTKWANDMQTIADHIGKKSEGKTQVSMRASELEKEPFI